MSDWEKFAVELGSIGALSMLESRLEGLVQERDAARRLCLALADRIAAQAELLGKRAERCQKEAGNAA